MWEADNEKSEYVVASSTTWTAIQSKIFVEKTLIW